MGARLAVFDCDGTLIDGQAAICDAMDCAFAEAGLAPPARNEVRRAVGLSLPQAVRRLTPEADAEVRRLIVDAYKRAFRAAREAGTLEQPLFEGMEQLLDELRDAGWLLGVATGMSDRGLAHCLAGHGLADRFDTMQTADRHPSKPHPAMLEAAMAAVGADPRATAMIGDTAYDMAMAKAAGAHAIGVAWGYHAPEELREAGAEAVADGPDQLADILERIR
jgi:phosphoglycolate phosphatase